MDKAEVSKTLGLLWDSSQHNFEFKVSLPSQTPSTKREVAQIFDPLGLVSLVLIKRKMLMQKLWADGLDWDQQLSEEHCGLWNEYYSSLAQLNELRIRRNVIPDSGDPHLDLFGFSDASEKTIGACIYAVSKNNQGQFTSSVICAKSKVAPLKTISLPRRELEAALLLAQLLEKTEAALGQRVGEVKLGSDSIITLGWIKTEPRLLKTFVANRVLKIRDLTEHASWYHIASQEKPIFCQEEFHRGNLEPVGCGGTDWLG